MLLWGSPRAFFFLSLRLSTVGGNFLQRCEFGDTSVGFFPLFFLFLTHEGVLGKNKETQDMWSFFVFLRLVGLYQLRGNCRSCFHTVNTELL